jgi:cell division transport system permease protein
VYHLKQAATGIKRAGYMSVACVIIMTCSLLIFGIFLLATSNLRELVRFAHGKVEIVAFLEEDLASARVDSMLTEIRAIPFIQTVRYVGPGRAMERLRKEFGERSHILDALDENPLPASVEITLKPQYRLRERVTGVAEHIEQMRGVEDTSYGRGWITALERLVRVLAVIDILVGVIVGVAAVVTVSYTVRLTLYARKELIRVLKLVGATDFFVMAPFLLEGMIHGAVSVGLGMLLLYMGYRAVDARISQVVFMPWTMIAFFIVFGVVVSLVGSLVSVRAFLEDNE